MGISSVSQASETGSVEVVEDLLGRRSDADTADLLAVAVVVEEPMGAFDFGEQPSAMQTHIPSVAI